jgi:hypothetical protein
LTPAIIKEVADLIPRTMYLETVADAIGVHRVTINRWLKLGGKEQRRRERGQEPNHKYDLHCQFCIAVKKALAVTESDHLQQIQAAGTMQWQACAWVLERRFLNKWSLNRGELRELKKRLADLEKANSGGAKQPQTAGAAVGATGEDTLI